MRWRSSAGLKILPAFPLVYVHQGALRGKGQLIIDCALGYQSCLTTTLPTFTSAHRDAGLFPTVGFHQNHPIAFIIVDHIVLHGDGRHCIHLISKVLHAHAHAGHHTCSLFVAMQQC